MSDALAEWNFSVSPYTYVSNNPINRIDLFGLAERDTHKDDKKSSGGESGAAALNPNEDDDDSLPFTDTDINYGVGSSAGIGYAPSSNSYNAGSYGYSYRNRRRPARGRRSEIAHSHLEYATSVNNYYGDPPWHVHEVKEGETVASIARLYSVPIDDILAANPNIRWRCGSTGLFRPEIYPYNPQKSKPWKWQGSIPPTWFVNKIIIPQPTNSSTPLNDIGLPGVFNVIPFAFGLISGNPDRLGSFRPGGGQENRAYYYDKFGTYYEFHYINSSKTSMEINLFDSFRKINGVWRGTHKHGSIYYGTLNSDDSWTISIGI